MSDTTGGVPVVRVAHRLPGRVRFRIEIDQRGRLSGLPQRLRQPGILEVRADPLTGSVLVRFDPQSTSDVEIQQAIEHALTDAASPASATSLEPAPLNAQRASIEHRTLRVDSQGHHWQRLRLRVPGLEGNHALARQIEETLEQAGVRVARASVTTGRLLVEHEIETVDLDSILETISGISLPEEPPTVRRTVVPTDRGPLLYAAWRTTATAGALAFLAARQLLGIGPLTTSPLPGLAADTVTVLRGFPAFREGLRRILGPVAADVSTSSVSILAQTANNQQLGLLVSLTESLRLLSALLPWRRAWQRYESELLRSRVTRPAMRITLRPGDRSPFDCRIERGSGEVLCPDGHIEHVRPFRRLPAGSLVLGGELTGLLLAPPPTEPFSRSEPHPPLLRWYLRFITPLAFAYAGFAGLVTRSLAAAARALVLVNARTALIGAEAADLGAVARALRGGALVTALRPHRRLTRPTVLLFDHPGLLIDGLELDRCLLLTDQLTVGSVLTLATRLATDTPWRTALPVSHGHLNGLDPDRFRLAVINLDKFHSLPTEVLASLRDAPLVLGLFEGHADHLVALLPLRPKLRPHLATLHETAKRVGTQLLVRISDGEVPPWLETTGLAIIQNNDPVELVATLRTRGEIVLYVADHGTAGRAFAAAHYSALLTSSRHPVDIPVDVLIPDLGALASLLETGQRRDAAVRDSVVFSLAANVLALGVGLGATPSPILVGLVIGGGAFLALLAGWARLWGGERQTTLPFVDPEPERWGAKSPSETLELLNSRPEGLTSAEVRQRRSAPSFESTEGPWIRALISQLSSPLLAIMAAGAGLSLAVGASLDVAIITGTLIFNVAVGAWQEQRVSRAAVQLAELSAPPARVLRDGQEVTLPATELVPGDVIRLEFGDRVPADARLLTADNLLVDESALTGESLPVIKDATATDERAVVLAGTDILSGNATAVVIATGEATRLGAAQRALHKSDMTGEHLAKRLAQYTRLSLPISLGAGALVTLAGILRGAPVASQLAVGASLAIAAVPEGLPLLSRLSEAATARRLAQRGILVRQLSAVEALGRVNVLCVDKTGTLTYGRMSVRRIVSDGSDEELSPTCSLGARQVIAAALLASPALDRKDALAHATDAAIIEAARRLELPEVNGGDERLEELPFDSLRPYHAVRMRERVVIKGSHEYLLPRCVAVRLADGSDAPCDPGRLQSLHEAALRLAQDGLRVLLVVEGPATIPLDDPRDLVVLGLIGIADALRPRVPDAVRRCHEAGVRVLMITGDHPATAEAIAREAGLPVGPERILNASLLRELEDHTLVERLAQASVVARATPLDKLRIVQLLRAHGDVVAMTGDGVNDAPALRLADVGIAMGWGTAVAREAADLVLTRDDFEAIVDALVQGRSFWRNMRRSVALLLGGNLGELGMIAVPTLFTVTPPLNTRQVLMVNLITDVPPALAIALQQPRYRRLTDLAREGEQALDHTLRIDVLRRAATTAIPAGLVTLWAYRALPAEASTIGFASLVAAQIAQALELGVTGSGLTPSLLTGVAASTLVLAASLTIPPARALLGLAPLSPTGLAATAVAVAATVLSSRLSTTLIRDLPALPAPRPSAVLSPRPA